MVVQLDLGDGQIEPGLIRCDAKPYVFIRRLSFTCTRESDCVGISQLSSITLMAQSGAGSTDADAMGHRQSGLLQQGCLKTPAVVEGASTVTTSLISWRLAGLTAQSSEVYEPNGLGPEFRKAVTDQQLARIMREQLFEVAM